MLQLSASSLAVISGGGVNPCSSVEISLDECLELNNSDVEGSKYTPSCAAYNGGDLWNYVVIPESGNIVFQTNSNGGLNDTGIQIWTAQGCFPLDGLACDDDGGNNYFSYINLDGLTAGDTVYIQTWGYGGAAGRFELCVYDPGIISLYESSLPIFIIDTGGEEIPDEPKIDATLDLIYNG